MEHPITPPPELVRQWAATNGTHYEDLATLLQSVATQAAQWGAARRPKPPSLAAKALDAAEDMSDCMNDGFVPNRSSLDIIRTALKRLQELEKGNE